MLEEMINKSDIFIVFFSCQMSVYHIKLMLHKSAITAFMHESTTHIEGEERHSINIEKENEWMKLMNKLIPEASDGLFPLFHNSPRHNAKSLKNQTNIKPRKHGLNQCFPSILMSYYLK